ncbi:hypothetical protein J4416_02305 [Candidatus Pacearchaeota archaeon]|nr:hypothetical protein [Candidatus Pacearchaeota archaeon]
MFNKKSIGLIFVSLILFSFVAGIVSAQSSWWQNLFGGGSSAQSGVFEPVKDLFTNWEKGNLDVNIAKYLFWLIVTLFVYSVVGFIPVLNDKLHGSVKFILALIVGFLSTAYITPSDVYTTLAGYSALGFVLSALLPLIVLLFFSIEISKGDGVGGLMISKFMWFALIIFWVWKLVDGMFGFTTGGTRVINLTQGWIYIGVIAFAVIWLLFLEKQFLKVLFKAEGKSYIDELNANTIASLEGQLAVETDRIAAITGDTNEARVARSRIDRKITQIKEKILKYKRT